jgi:hypothetical protein
MQPPKNPIPFMGGSCQDKSSPLTHSKEIVLMGVWRNKDIRDALWGLRQDLLSHSLDGTMSIAMTEFLKGQKKGELMMVGKCLELIKKWFPVFKGD